jgi:DNA polymerase-3 subunit beta
MDNDSATPSKDRLVLIEPKFLKAVAMIAARRDIRYYLNGVLVEILESEVRLVSTDGHKLLIIRKDQAYAELGRFIVPHEVLSLIRPKPKSQEQVQFRYGATASDKVTMLFGGLEIGFRPIDGVFPDYSRIVDDARKPSGELGHFNPDYLADFARAASAAYGQSTTQRVQIWPNGRKPTPVTYGREKAFFGLLMPMHGLEEHFTFPEWLPEKVEEQKPEIRREAEAVAA